MTAPEARRSRSRRPSGRFGPTERPSVEHTQRPIPPMMSSAHFREIQDELMESHARNGNLAQFGHRLSAHQYLRLYRLVAAYVEQGSAVLDWGAGNGHFSYFLVRSGYRASGYGFGPLPQVCSAFAADAYAYKVADPATPTSLPYDDESFDAVASVGVLEHVRETGGDEVESLRQIHRILRRGGLFICFHLPNRSSWIEGALRLVRRWSHRYRYTAEDIHMLAESASLKVVELRRYAILPRNIWWWGRGRRGVSTSLCLARLYDGLDDLLSRLASPVCQNYLFVARKNGES